MNTISSNDSYLSTLAQPQAETAVRNQLGQEEFLTLMITQLQNQDPLQPMDDGQFIGQMAQFSTVEGIDSMRQSLETLSQSLTSTTALQASTMVGRSVLIDGDSALLQEGQPLKGGVELPAPISNATVRITDAGGQLVRDLPLGPRNQGVATFEWDGTKNDGSTAEPGTYFISAAFRNGAADEALPTYVVTQVESVTLTAGGTAAEISTANGERVSLAAIKAIM